MSSLYSAGSAFGLVWKVSGESLDEAATYFPKNYLEKIASDTGRVARLGVSQKASEHFGVNNYLPQKDHRGRPEGQRGVFWSVADKIKVGDAYVAAAISTEPVGVDLECVVPRSRSLLEIFPEEEYVVLGGKTLVNFYKLWTAKEAVIKKVGSTLGVMKDMKCIGCAGETIYVLYQQKQYDTYILLLPHEMVLAIA